MNFSPHSKTEGEEAAILFLAAEADGMQITPMPFACSQIPSTV
ncbi:hypothetical protein C725_0361 [Pacificimonas flava]|uniref:Uncharacterized protein n=1 Tax=Pacificimonas flava TaxID=1234595 RepID=M2TRM7_9SPHN|nr:hypothetical protein C725_0361 [Pacificimonas flava]